MISLRTQLKIATRNIFRQRRRSALTLAAIAVGLLSCLILSVLARGMEESLRIETLAGFTGHIQIHAPDYRDDPTRHHRIKNVQDIEARLHKNPSIASLTRRIRVPGLVMSERTNRGLTILGINPATEYIHSRIDEKIVAGRALHEDDTFGIVLGKATAEKLRTRIGKRVVLMTEGPEGDTSEVGLTLIGLFDAPGEALEQGFALITLSQAAQVTGLDADVSEVELLVHDINSSANIAETLRPLLPDYEISTWKELLPFLTSMKAIQTGFLILWFCIVGITALFGLLNTLYMSVLERTRELGLMSALGMPPRFIRKEILLESLLLLLAGACLANLLSLVVYLSLVDGFDLSAFAKGMGRFGMSRVVIPRLLPFDWIIANTILLVAGALGSILPAYRATSMDPLEALRAAE